MSKTRVVLDGHPDPAKAVYELGMASGWSLAQVVEPTESRPAGLSFRSASGASGISFVEDHVLDLAYAVLHGPESTEVLEQLAEVFDIVDSEAVRRMSQDTLDSGEPERLASILCRAAITARGEAHPWVLALFKQALSHAHPGLRYRAIEASTYTGLDRSGAPWPQLVEAIVPLVDDVNPAVADLASRILAANAALFPGGGVRPATE